MLNDLSLSSLAQTKLAGQFEEALQAITESLKKDGDVQGERSITIRLGFKPDDRGFVTADMSVTASTPKRKVKTIAALDGGKLKIDTISNDAQQPDIFDGENVVNIKTVKGGE